MKVTLDDFGISLKANREIYKWTKEKKIDYVSVLTNTHFTSDAIRIYKNDVNKKYKLGLHFNLIEGRPLSAKSKVKSLVDKHGRFYPLPIFIFRLFMGRIQKNDILAELQKQYDVFISNGIVCSHINSHQNIHVFHYIYSCILEFAKNNNIPNIRQVPTVQNRLKKFPIKYFIFILLYSLSSLLFFSHKYTHTSFVETTFHPGTQYDS